jgi:hypothetical protein
VGIPTDANITMDTETEERCFLCGLCQDVISRSVGSLPASQSVSQSVSQPASQPASQSVECTELIGESVSLSRAAVTEYKDSSESRERGTSAIGGRYQKTGEDTAS